MAPKTPVKKDDKAKKEKKATKTLRSKPVSGKEKAGIQFSTGRCTSYLRRGRYAERISPQAGVFMAGVLDYLCCEILEISGSIAQQDGEKVRIKPRHI